MKSKLIVISISMLIFALYLIRVVYINTNTLAPKVTTYKVGDEVPIENDYFNSSDEKMDGYTITVLDSKIVSIDEFQAEHAEFVNELHADNIYLVKVLVKNIDNKLEGRAGIDFGHYMIQNGSFMNIVSRDAYPFVNNFDTLAFSLRYGSEMEFILPFNINSRYIDIDKLETEFTDLVVSLYPHQKIIYINQLK